MGVYYRKRKELINPKLRALEKKKKITKPPAFALAPKTNQIINFGARPVQSIRVFCACAQNQSCNQLWGALTLITRQHAAPSPLFIAWGSPPSSFVYQLTNSPFLLSRQGPTHPSTPFVQAARLKSGSSMSLFQFINISGCGENCIQSSACFSVAR